ncbi:MAG TPA: DUF3619 family protein [Burkholderiaceae bacterium]|nr:DUF3619 family protein [Burkholderiaceae bacterium]
MNDPINRRPSSADAMALEARFGLRVAARLSDRADDLPHDITERLRSAREQALAKARPRLATARAAAVAVSASGTATLASGGPGDSWWWRLSSLAPLVLLIAGLVWVHEFHRSEEILAVAEVDAALLTDAVPPSAYADPGFAEFLKAPLDPSAH